MFKDTESRVDAQVSSHGAHEKTMVLMKEPWCSLKNHGAHERTMVLMKEPWCS